ncbi:SigB/SigF/SigG family RNA polymerase sigma factor [Actinoplanes sp. NPDC089786]|uniref:SigB/SigF/SigG family RNA polymerase sigma factor n=1 Tax=Actinoplanes sp. NPDC089786 TaxID=3155185 RepID=UPI003422F002
MRTTTSAPTGSHRTEEDERADRLMLAFCALPPSHPDRRSLREQVIEAWLPMAYRLARRYARQGDMVDDLRQTATIGLIKAVDRFDAGRGVEFVGFAFPTITGEIKRYFRDRTWSVRAPRRVQETRLAIGRARVELGQTLGRSPTVADLAGHLNTSEEELLEGLESSYAYRAVSLSTPIHDDSGFELGDILGAQDHGYDLVELNVTLPPAMARLTDRERRIIAMRFYGNQTQAAIAEQIGVSQMHISRILSGALLKLREQLVETE